MVGPDRAEVGTSGESVRPGPGLAKRVVGAGLWFGVPLFLVAGWWYLRNLILFGDPTGLPLMLNVMQARELPPTWRELAVQMAARRVVVAGKAVDNGHGTVPSVLFDVVTVTRDNILDTVVRDGQATYDDVYRGVPDAQRPPRP